VFLERAFLRTLGFRSVRDEMGLDLAGHDLGQEHTNIRLAKLPNAGQKRLPEIAVIFVKVGVELTTRTGSAS
jgi:hypothetical protein